MFIANKDLAPGIATYFFTSYKKKRCDVQKAVILLKLQIFIEKFVYIVVCEDKNTIKFQFHTFKISVEHSKY